FQRELRVGSHVGELRESMLPVIAVRRHHVWTVYGVGVGPCGGHPRIAHLNDLGHPAGLPGRFLIYVRQGGGVGQARAGRAHEAVGEPAGAARRRGYAGADPERWPRLLERPRTNLDVLERVVLAAERKPLARPA